MFGKETKTQVSYSDRLANIKSLFKKAYDNASNLNNVMQNDINAKEESIKVLEAKIAKVKQTQKETQDFIKNLKKFI